MSDPSDSMSAVPRDDVPTWSERPHHPAVAVEVALTAADHGGRSTCWEKAVGREAEPGCTLLYDLTTGLKRRQQALRHWLTFQSGHLTKLTRLNFEIEVQVSSATCSC